VKPTLESKIERDACKEIFNYLGIKNSKLKTDENGFPDRMFWMPNGKPFFIEFKRPGEVPEKLQAHRHTFLESLGYTVETHDNVADAFQAVFEKVDTKRLPLESLEILDRASKRLAALRSRAR